MHAAFSESEKAMGSGHPSTERTFRGNNAIHFHQRCQSAPISCEDRNERGAPPQLSAKRLQRTSGRQAPERPGRPEGKTCQ